MIIFKLIKQIVGIFSAPKTIISRFDNLIIWIKTKCFQNSKIFNSYNYKINTPTASLLNAGIWEIFISLDYYFHTNNKSPLIIDAGANIGVATLFFKKLYPFARIICFEPDPEAFTYLNQNIKDNRLEDVSLFALALSSNSGDQSFYRLKNRTTSMGSLIKDDVHTEEIKIKTARLSDYVTSEVDFLKLDIENQELAVIKELAEKKKLSLIKQLVIDWHTKEDSLYELLNILKHNGFKIQISSSCKRPFDISNHVNLLIYAIRI